MNTRVDRVIAPPKYDRREIFAFWMAAVDFDRALHLGCGRDKDGLGKRIETKGDVVALDPNPAGLAKNEVSQKVLGDAHRLPLSGDAFDFVFCRYVFEHLPDPHAALNEIDRVLRPGGTFMVLVPNPRHYYARIADATPFWFHKLWFEFQGIDDHEEDRFPTEYAWGRLEDIEGCSRWELEAVRSFPGPTNYTRVLPFHVLFSVLARLVEHRPKYHVAYLARFRAPR
ncbi:class I SAM-dependent methyltransferase [Salinarchaeum laminariae]|uniref:class I SAM-dependent methyltransferase n=1 Tax=Salinarchaeum laminariae TaxID=869888 RepID=UPI0020BE2E13|nr:class I SAM-dependent methyltransferase [Salinarchaeum laminariae]